MSERDERKDFVFKITVIGDGGVGKTSLIKKYTKGSFKKEYIKTLGAQFSKYDEKIGNSAVKLFFWDIAGQAEFSFMRPTFYKGSKAAIIVFSHAPKEIDNSFKHISEWHEDIKKYCGNIPIVLFGNKIDLVNDELNKSKVEEIVDKRDFLGYYNTSAKTGNGVYEAFQAIIKDLYEKYKDQ